MNMNVTDTNITEVVALTERIEAHLYGHILPFWCETAVDHDEGGWMAWLSNDLQVDRSKPKGLIVHSRILWAFSSAYQSQPDPIYKQMADRAFDYLMGRFWDPLHGGVFWQIGGDGHVMDDSKKIYGHAFCIYALAEYYDAFGSEIALAKAFELFELIEKNAYDPVHGGYIEVCRRDWSAAGPEARLSEKDQSEKKSMNNQLHVLEAYTNLYRVTREPRVGERLCGLIKVFESYILDPQTLHFHHFFDEEWIVKSDTYTFGHDIEGSWLLCEAAEVLEDSKLVERVRDVALKMAEKVLIEGVDSGGAICYEGQSGHVIDAGKECWPQAEALVGFLNAFQISGDLRYYNAAAGVWGYIENHIADRVDGEWFWRINSDGRPDQILPKVSEWKGPYHGTRACLEAIRRLRLIANS
jgi:mannobiose 2-epimerase